MGNIPKHGTLNFKNKYIYVINSLIGVVNASMVCQYLIDNYSIHEV